MPETPLPFAERDSSHTPGHWLLARLGKRVLRPGGRELTEWLLNNTSIKDAKVVEFAPGLGLTAREILSKGPTSYTGVDADPDAAARSASVVGNKGKVINTDANETGLPDGSATAVVGEAMLSMQGDRGKHAIIAEAFRILAPGGEYSIHELGLKPDDVGDEVKTNLRKELATTIKVNARPMTMTEWRALLESEGFEVKATNTAAMALLEPKRLLSDEGLGGVLRIIGNALRDGDARRRALTMKKTFKKNANHLCAVALVATKPAEKSATEKKAAE